MPVPSYIAVLKRHKTAAEDVQKYFMHLPALVKDYPWEASIAYAFILVERAQNRTLYGAAVKLHRAHTDVARPMFDSLHETRASFLKLYERMLSQALPDPTVAKLKFAEKVRDRTVHGKNPSDPDFRQALVDVLDYAEGLNSHVEQHAGFRPFGDMRGFKGAAQPLEKETSRWLLRGLLAE
jgi:hypothetical protein